MTTNKLNQWEIGDRLNAHKNKYGETYSEALNETGMAYSTLQDYKWIANKIQARHRYHNLCWTVHFIASQLKDKQKCLALLKKASKETDLHKQTNGKQGQKWTVSLMLLQMRRVANNIRPP